MTERPWSRFYGEGVAPEIGPLPYQNLPDMVRQASARHPGGPAFTQCMPNGMDASLTAAEVDRHSDRFAAYLREELKLEPGDRVAVQLPNALAYPIVAFGVFKAGCVLVNTNPLYTPAEMAHQFADSGARVLVIIDMFADRLPPVLPKTAIETVVTVRVTEFYSPVQALLIRSVLRFVRRQLPRIRIAHTPFQETLAVGRGHLEAGADLAGYAQGIELDDVAALQYTGGTTGVSKGAMLSHGNLLSNMRQILEMNTRYLLEGETVLTVLPLYHIFAFTVNLLAFYDRGARNILVPSPRPPSTLKAAWEKYPITWFTGVNTLFNALLNEPWFSSDPPKRLKSSVAGGTALHTSVSKRWREVTGTPVVEGYGLTESSPVVSFNPFGVAPREGSIGIPLPSTDVRCIGEDRQIVATGEAGELAVRGPQVMLGYWNRPDETAKVLDDGWLCTGDVATIDDDGFLRIVDRKKDMILVSGFNVYPNEVEECLSGHPGIREVAVIGVPDERTGEAVKAFVVARDASLTAEAVVAFARETLAAYKVPKQVEFRDDLPKSVIGKILRKELRTPEP